jgi:predicted secreted protein
MTTKLNLSIEEELVQKIKVFAKKNNRSVSEIVSDQFKAILNNGQKKKLSFSERAAGIVKGKKFDDLNKLREQYLKDGYDL